MNCETCRKATQILPDHRNKTAMPEPRIFTFPFPDLHIAPGHIEMLMGCEGAPLPDIYSGYIEEVLRLAEGIEGIAGAYLLYDSLHVDGVKRTTMINHTAFQTGPVITRRLRKAQAAALFVCTAGPELEIASRRLMKSGSIPEGYLADLAGTVIVEAAMDRIQEHLMADADSCGLGITNRYSPGYCGWNVEEQRKLFSLLPAGLCGVRLTASSLMQPIKSISGVIGIGPGLKPSPYACNICDMKDCLYRYIKKSNRILPVPCRID